MIDIILHWEIPSQERYGYIILSGLHLGARHALLHDVLSAERPAKRSMYAETEKERREIMDGFERSKWNEDSMPVSVDVRHQDRLAHDFNAG